MLVFCSLALVMKCSKSRCILMVWPPLSSSRYSIITQCRSFSYWQCLRSSAPAVRLEEAPPLCENIFHDSWFLSLRSKRISSIFLK